VTAPTTDPAITSLQRAFDPAPGYLNAASLGLPPRTATRALLDAVRQWATGGAGPSTYEPAVARSRELFAALAGVELNRVAIGSQVSVTTGVVAASLPDGARVVCVDGDFTSMVFPFLVHADRGVSVRHVPLAGLAEALVDGDDLVAFSVAQSADGRVADVDAVLEAAARHGVRTYADLTQSAGWLAGADGTAGAHRFDLTVTSAYKWLCAPRGSTFTTVSGDAERWLRPVAAGWFAGESVWDSCYGPGMRLARDARRFDVSPAWLSFVGTAPALELVVGLDAGQRASGARLADDLRRGLDLAPQGRPVLALDDPDGSLAAGLAAAGATVASRAGRVRIAFHLWNGPDDVARVLAVLRDRGRRGRWPLASSGA
jgi:selenocysteine lyase/cysteine desulfurase